MARILVVDDEPKMTSLVCGTLEDDGHAVTTTTSPAEALDLLDKHSFDLVITDLAMPQITGMQILEHAMQKEGVDVILMTAYGTVQNAVEAMKKGAADYLVKPFSLEELSIVVRKLAERQRTVSLAGHFQQEARARFAGRFVGSSPAAEQVRRLIVQVAPTEATVLLTGRSGTGKELAARMLHDNSKRAGHPFIAVNCAAITETLLESELFGHEKGSFTGATARKRGRFELAHGGTLFLDEIGEMSAGMQSKLLRVLEERVVVRVGGVDTVPVNVRVIAATNRELREEIKSGGFREDLYFRLNVFPIAIPPLAERSGDVLELAEQYLADVRYAHPMLENEVRTLLTAYDWPGNVRELRNALERAMILAGGEPITVADFDLQPTDAPLSGHGSTGAKPGAGLEHTEKQMILEALQRAGGNKAEAARLLQITRRRLYSRMKSHGLEP